MLTRTSQAEQFYFYGWNEEQNKAWRCLAREPGARMFTENIVAQKQDLDPVIAAWPDGDTQEIPEMLSASWRARCAELAQKKPPGVSSWKPSKTAMIHFTGRAPSGEEVVVKDRKDRNKLVSIYIAGKQKLQCAISAELDHDKAKNVSVELAKRLCAGEIEANELYRARNLAFNAMGVALTACRSTATLGCTPKKYVY